MHPEAGEPLSRGALRLRDLVLVVGEDEVHAARVDIDGRSVEQTQRHRRAFDVPAGAARTDAVVPGGLVRPGRLPQDEVARRVLGVLVAVDAGAILHAGVIEPRELAVVGQRGDPEVHRAVAAVGVTARFERLDGRHHRPQVLLVGRARRLLRRLDAEGLSVFPKRRDVAVGVLAQRYVGLAGAGNRLVVHVREVDDLAHAMTADMPQARGAARRGRRRCGSCRCAPARKRSDRRRTCAPCRRAAERNPRFDGSGCYRDAWDGA